MIHYESNLQWFLLLTLLLLLIGWKNCLAIKIKLHKQNKNHKSWPNITSLRSYSPWNNTVTKSFVPLIILKMFNLAFKENEKLSFMLCISFRFFVRRCTFYCKPNIWFSPAIVLKTWPFARVSCLYQNLQNKGTNKEANKLYWLRDSPGKGYNKIF